MSSTNNRTPGPGSENRATRSDTRSVVNLCALTVLVVGGLLFAGPLDPPAGPVASTYKTLSEVEPRTAVNATNTPGDADSLFKITQPGSYYLTGNITGVVGKHGIEIAASGGGSVTLDLNGFNLVGIPAMGLFDGVSITLAGLSNIAVVNGSVSNWGDEGVDLGGFGATNSRVEGVLASGNSDIGILTGPGGTVDSCTANNNSGNGIHCIGSCTVTNCSAYRNGGSGFYSNEGSTFTNCSANQNTGNGINTTIGCTVTVCTATFNMGSGFNVNSGCTVADCTARSNAVDGIACFSSCMIRGNTCSGNGSGAGDGAGIHATSTNNRVEGNNCTLADRGIDVDAPGNIILKNTCSANTTSWDVVAGNVILVVNGIGAPAVLGTAGGTAPGSADPNANFSY